MVLGPRVDASASAVRFDIQRLEGHWDHLNTPSRFIDPSQFIPVQINHRLAMMEASGWLADKGHDNTIVMHRLIVPSCLTHRENGVQDANLCRLVKPQGTTPAELPNHGTSLFAVDPSQDVTIFIAANPSTELQNQGRGDNE